MEWMFWVGAGLALIAAASLVELAITIRFDNIAEWFVAVLLWGITAALIITVITGHLAKRG